MSQYQDYFFSDLQRDGQYSMLQSPVLSHKNVSGMNFLIDHQFFKENHVTVDPSDFTEIANSSHQTFFKQQCKYKNSSKRVKNVIQMRIQSQERRMEVVRGLKDDTTQLNVNFKTILAKNLKEFAILKEFGHGDIQIIQQFMKTGPSFSGIKILCQSSHIKSKQLKFIKSHKIIKQILTSNGSIQNKMSMLKYVESLKGNFQSQKIIKWKNCNSM